MKLFKKFTAALLVATLVFGSAVTAFAGDATGVGIDQEGTGSFEGVDPALPEIVITLPTASSTDDFFNYTADPNKLMRTYGGDTLTANLPAAASDTYVYFETADSKWANQSQEVEVINENARDMDIDVEISVKGTYSGHVGFSETGTWEATDTSKELFLAVAEKDKATNFTPLGTSANTFTMVIAGKPSNYDVTRSVDASGKGIYEFTKKSTVTSADFNKSAFFVKGAINTNASWKDEDEAVPDIKLTWSWKEHVVRYVNKTTIAAGGNAQITLALPDGVSLSTVTIVKDDASTVTAVQGTHYGLNGTTLTMMSVSSAWASVKVTFSDGHEDVITVN